MTQPCDLGALSARKLIGHKQLSPVELMKSCLDRISACNEKVNAIVAIDADRAMERARQDEKAVMDGQDLPLLHGLPVAIKDLESVEGLRTTFGSLLFENHVPDEDESSVETIRSAGGNIFCKTNTPEFGAGANTKNRVYGATGNPFNTDLTSAGSSGGSAAALACGMTPLATGSDYGGSLRTPAAYCGVTGFRPSPGMVPIDSSSLRFSPFSVLGPMGRTVEDAHLLLLAQMDINCQDPFSSEDIYSIPTSLVDTDLSSLRIAYSADLGCSPVDLNIREIFSQRIADICHYFGESFDRAPYMEHVHETFEILRCVSFVAEHQSQLEQSRDLLGPNVIDNTERGQQYSLKDVAWAHTQQAEIYDRFQRYFDDCAILICPTAAVSPFPHKQLTVTEINGEEMPTYMRWLSLAYALTTAVSSVCSIPCGVDHRGMPFGLQIVGPKGADALVLEVAHSLQIACETNPSTSRPVPMMNSV